MAELRPRPGRIMTTITPLPDPRCPRPVRAPERAASASAPMRVSLAGGGSDLPPFVAGLGGRIVGAALDLRTRARVEPFDRGWVRLSVDVGEVGGAEGGLVLTRRRADPRRAEAPLLEHALALADVGDGVHLAITTPVIPGAGLGGSAAAAVAALAALRASVGAEPAAEDLAADAVRLEREGLGNACGSQDPTFAAHGGLLDLRFDEHGLRDRVALDVDPALLAALGAGMLLVDTGERRVSGEVLGRARFDEAGAALLVAAAALVAEGLLAGSLDRVVAGMRANASAKTARDPAASTAALALAARLSPLGAEVVRMCGAGGGGHVLVWAPPDRHGAILAALEGLLVRRPKLGAPGVELG
jgi:D-glycero-alpha-D-manno-heptose-7-phosphate kinase